MKHPRLEASSFMAMTSACLTACLLLSALAFSGCRRDGEDSEPVDIEAYVAEHYPDCSPPVICRELVYVNCGEEVDGPSYYLDKETGRRISICGGACWATQGEQAEVCRTLCPPKEWNCPR